MAPKPKTLVSTLSRRGPHRVLRGDLAYAGLPGLVCAPEVALGAPAVVFGHGWLTHPVRYLQTLAHLASWGIVTVAPATERGPVPSARAFAEDMGTAADIAVGVRLGRGAISVRPNRIAMVGHGFGAGAAALAAAGHMHGVGGSSEPHPDEPGMKLARRGRQTGARHPVAAVGALYPAQVSPPAEPAGGEYSGPALILAAPGENGALAPDAESLAEALANPGSSGARTARVPAARAGKSRAPAGASTESDGGAVTARVVPAAEESDIVEGRLLAAFLGLAGSDRKLQATTRACLTGYLLSVLTGDKEYAVFVDTDTALPGTAVPVPEEEREQAASDASSGWSAKSLAGASLVHLLGRG